jgi:transcriptional regulator with XRE-family HTH domain
MRERPVGPISQEALAFSVGMTRVAVSRIENGRTWPQAQTLDRIFLELDIDCPTWQCEGALPRRRGSSMARGKTLECLNYASDCVRTVRR